MRIKLNKYYEEITKMKIKRGRLRFYYSLLRTSVHYLITKDITNPAYYMKNYSIVIYDECSFYIDHNTSFGYYLLLNIMEPITYSEIMNKRGQLLIDVGANCGGYTIRASKNFKKIISIEPVPIMREIINKNISLNGVNNVEILDAAVSDYNGTSRFYVSKLGQLSSFSEPVNYIESIDVKVTRLDKVIDEHGIIPDLVKIDAEGAEVECILGLGKYINKIPELIIEISSSDKLKKISNILNYYTLEKVSGSRGENYIFTITKDSEGMLKSLKCTKN